LCKRECAAHVCKRSQALPAAPPAPAAPAAPLIAPSVPIVCPLTHSQAPVPARPPLPQLHISHLRGGGAIFTAINKRNVPQNGTGWDTSEGRRSYPHSHKQKDCASEWDRLPWNATGWDDCEHACCAENVPSRVTCCEGDSPSTSAPPTHTCTPAHSHTLT